MERTPFLAFCNIKKSFPGVCALDNVSFSAFAGEVHVLCGENGAGKSTLMKIINGIHRPDSGDILIAGESVRIHSPEDAKNRGIAMIFQECSFVPEMTLMESLFMGELPLRKAFGIDWKQIERRAHEILFDGGVLSKERCPRGVRTQLKDLSIADIQMLEIARAIRKDSKLLILDEPTSSITQKEADELLQKIISLKKGGKAIIYISHKMDEIFQIADRISVLRDGMMIESGKANQFDRERVIRLMVGRELSEEYPKEEVAAGEELLRVESLSRHKHFSGIHFYLRAGEIVGFAGLVGAGRTALVRSISGLEKIDGGKILIRGVEAHIRSVSDSIRHGMVMCSEDRRRYGLVLVRSIRENITLASLVRYFLGGRLHKKKENSEVHELKERLHIKAPSCEVPVGTLSGGNQQKAVLAKWLLRDPSVFFFDEPTRGIDVGAKYEIYRLMTDIVKTGTKGIVMISSELGELIGMCDRIYVMCAGAITAELKRTEFSQELIMQYATGSKRGEV